MYVYLHLCVCVPVPFFLSVANPALLASLLLSVSPGVHWPCVPSSSDDMLDSLLRRRVIAAPQFTTGSDTRGGQRGLGDGYGTPTSKEGIKLIPSPLYATLVCLLMYTSYVRQEEIVFPATYFSPPCHVPCPSWSPSCASSVASRRSIPSPCRRCPSPPLPHR